MNINAPLIPREVEEETLFNRKDELLMAAQQFLGRQLDTPLTGLVDAFNRSVANLQTADAVDLAYMTRTNKITYDKMVAMVCAHEDLSLKKSFLEISAFASPDLSVLEEEIHYLEVLAANEAEYLLEFAQNGMSKRDGGRLRAVVVPNRERLMDNAQNGVAWNEPAPSSPESHARALAGLNAKISNNLKRVAVFILQETELDLGYYALIYGKKNKADVPPERKDRFLSRKVFSQSVLAPRIKLVAHFCKKKDFYDNEATPALAARIFAVN